MNLNKFSNCCMYRQSNGKQWCAALKILDCDDCNFYKTQEQVEEEEKLVQARHKKIRWMKGDKD